ncbi:hypothetical protein SANBI_001382 [Sanguibacter sp. 4.1]|uniref:Uncharacterized protein n=1 Tax=Sanguibacter biliveldensis TaxID=3030830 RepID=A0AAF1C016_9MICO|nr:hypothetical protein [Sanguibacter sp. 4.1]WPF83687.1 hypothetical protein SANBI_001382 [Sanguibacter sp. 4.1]
MESVNPFVVVWSQAKKAGLQLYLVPLAVAIVYILVLTGAQSLGFDPVASDPAGAVLMSTSIVVVAVGCVFRARWRPGISRWMGICTAATWWWVALEFSSALASGRELPFNFFGAALVLSMPYALFFHPLGQAQSAVDSRKLVAEVVAEFFDGQSRMLGDEGRERDTLLVERLDHLMEEIATLRRGVCVDGSDRVPEDAARRGGGCACSPVKN